MSKESTQYIFARLRPYSTRAILIILFLFLDGIGSLASPYLLKVIIDDVFPSRNAQLLFMILGSLIAIYLVRIVASFFASYLYVKLGNSIIFDIRRELFDHLIKLPYTFFLQNDRSEIISRINNEVTVVKQVITGSAIKFLYDSILIVGLVVMLCALDFQLFLLTSAIIPVLIFSVRAFNKEIFKATKSVRESESRLLQFFMERFENIRVILLNGLTNKESRLLKDRMSELSDLEIRAVKYTALSSNIATFLIALTPIIVFGWGGKGVFAGSLTVGSLVAFIQYMNRLFTPVKDLAFFYSEITKGVVSIDRLREYLKLPITKPSAIEEFTFSKGERISIERVHYKPCERIIFNDLSIRMEIGKNYSIVGQSGSGKSTLIDLLCCLLYPQHGDIKIAGVPLTVATRACWLDRVAVVGHRELLFNLPLIDNLLYFKSPGSSEEFQKIMDITGVEKVASRLEHGYATVIGSDGVKLSNGEIQRIAIARALMKKFQILILDEATSALDSESEKKLLTNIKREFDDRTLILVSHRLSTVKEADEILVLSDGIVVERGTHDDLVKRQSYYFRLFKDQMEFGPTINEIRY